MPAYLFDLDGTLIDSKEDIARSANAVREAFGLPPEPLEVLYGFIGEGVQRLVERTLGKSDPGVVERAIAQWRTEYGRRLLDNTRPFDGIPEALAAMPGPKAVVTNKPGAFARRIVEALGLAGQLPVVLGPDDVGARKPDPAMVHEALRRLAARPEEAVLVGDSAIDTQTAIDAGVRFVGVTWGLRPKSEMELLGARAFVTVPHQLPAACAAVLREPLALR